MNITELIEDLELDACMTQDMENAHPEDGRKQPTCFAPSRGKLQDKDFALRLRALLERSLWSIEPESTASHRLVDLLAALGYRPSASTTPTRPDRVPRLAMRRTEAFHNSTRPCEGAQEARTTEQSDSNLRPYCFLSNAHVLPLAGAAEKKSS